MDVLDDEKEDIWREMDMELETFRSLLPRVISPLTGIEDSRETRTDAAVDARKWIPTEKGRQFAIQRLKENRKTALANLTSSCWHILRMKGKCVKKLVC